MAGFDRVRALTFDCYGTLVDWESGILRDLRTGISGLSSVSDEALLSLFAEIEPAVQAGPFRPYCDVLREVLLGIGRRLGRPVADPDALVRGLGSWPVFPDVPGALGSLGRRFRLVVVSNVDRALFDETARRIGVPFDDVVTAEDVRSYKPAPAHLVEAMRRLGLGPDSVLHVAQSLFHDIAPAKALGLRVVWVDRRRGRGGGATPTPSAETIPDLRVGSLAELVGHVESTLP